MTERTIIERMVGKRLVSIRHDNGSLDLRFKDESVMSVFCRVVMNLEDAFDGRIAGQFVGGLNEDLKPISATDLIIN